MTKLHFKSFDSPLPLTRLPVTKQHFKSFDYPPHHRWPTHLTTCDETALQVLWLPTALLTTHSTTCDETALQVLWLPPHHCWPTHSTTCDETALQVLWLPTTLPLTDPLDYLWRNSTSSPLTPHHTTADRPTRLPVTKQHFKSFDYPPHHRWPTHSTTCDETALQVLWLPTALLLTDPLDNIWRNSTSSPLTPHGTTADRPTRLPVTKQHFKSFDSPPYHRWPTHLTTCDETALQVLWLPTTLPLTDPLDYLWRNSTSSPLTTHRTTADRPTRLPVTKLHFKSFDSPRHYCWLTHSTTYDETALQVLWLPTALLLIDPLDYLWRNSTSSPFTSPYHRWPTHLTTCDETALQVLWLPTTLPLTDPLDYLWRNSTSSPLTTHRTTADQPTRLPVTKLHFKSFDSPRHYCWSTHSTTCDETALQVLWLPTAPPLTNPLDYLWRNCTSSPLTPHGTTADRWLTHSTTCDETALQVLWLPTAPPLTNTLDYLWRNCTSSPLTPHGTTADWPTRQHMTKQHFKSFDSPRHYCRSTHSTTRDETALQVLWLPTAPPLTNPLDYLWRNSTSSPLTPHHTTADWPTRLPVTKQHFKSFDYPPHHRWPTHSTTCDETALQVLWLPTALLLTDPLDNIWRNSTSSPLTPHHTTADWPTRLPVTKQHFKSFDYPPHHRWPTHSTTCDETALQVLWLPTAPLLIDPLPVTKLHFKSFDSPSHYRWPTHSTTCDKTALRVLWLPSALLLTDPLDYLWRNCTSSPLTPHGTTADRPTRLPVTKQHFKSFDYPPHHRWPTHSTTCDETALQVLWLPTAPLLTDPLDYLWRNSTSSPLTPHHTTADWPTRLPVTKQHFKSFDSPRHYCWSTHSTTCDETALQVLWLPTLPPLTDPLDYLWRNSTSSPLTPHHTTADRPTRLPVTKQHFKSFDYPPHHRWPPTWLPVTKLHFKSFDPHGTTADRPTTTCDETALQVLWLPTALPLTNPLDYLWRNSTSSPLTPHHTTADWPTRLPVTKQHF